MDDFYYNGHYLSDYGGMILKHSEINNVGLDGSIINKKLIMSLLFFDNSSSNLQKVRNWIEIQNTNEFVWKGSNIKLKAVFTGMVLVGSGVNIEFTATYPYWDYLKEETATFQHKTDFINIHNNGDCTSYPFIKFFGSGDISVKLRDKAFIIKNVWNYVSIDMREGNAFRDNLNKTFDFQGDFLKLECGQNTLDIKGEWTSMQVICRSRWSKYPEGSV